LKLTHYRVFAPVSAVFYNQLDCQNNMLGNLTFTLYEVFGYLLPGFVALHGILVLYWAFFVPSVSLEFPPYQLGLVTWTALVVASYLLGHAVQGVGNALLNGAEDAALSSSGTAPQWMRERAAQLAGKLLALGSTEIKPVWVVRTLDEYSVQAGEVGDRDMFVYREGFYRGTAIAIFFLSVALLVRAWIPGASIQFTKGVSCISTRQILSIALITSGVGRIFVRRYRRFAEYRITRAVLAAFVLENISNGVDSSLHRKGIR
jgi:hypothetical protein